MDYVDFELKVGTATAGDYPISVVRSPAGETDATMRLPEPGSDLDAAIRVVARARSLTRSNRGIAMAGDGEADDDPTTSATTLGNRLFEALLPGEVRSLYRESLALARQQEKGLRVRLRIAAPEIAALPWEFLFDGREAAHVALSSQTPITRYLQVERAAKALTVEPPLHILGMIASPSDRPGLDVERERLQMERAVQHLVDAGHLTMTWVDGQTWRDLQRELQPTRGPWHVFHFIGHGGFDEASGEGLVALCNDDGTTHRMPASQLANLLGDHPSLRLAVLNSCEGARGSGTDIFSGSGSAIIRRGVPAVVSMQFEITDEAALEFSRAFYDCLAEELPVDLAVTEARKAIDNHWEHKSAEWATPVLHMRSPDGLLFTLDMAARIFRGQSAPAPATPEASPATPVAALTGQAERGLTILRTKVRRFWVEGVLENALQHSPIINLGLDMMHGEVQSPWAGMIDTPAEESQALSPGHTIAAVFEEQGGSLLILGEPGSGKSTAMLALARDILDAGDADPTSTTPVVFNLSGWGRTARPLDDWMLSELSAKYQIPRKVGQTWLAGNRILPLLDGLDEVHAGQRDACVSAINAFTDGGSLGGVVVCCRYREYTELTGRLTLNAAVRLQRLSRSQVIECVTAGGERLAALARVLQRDSALLLEARSPLMLGIMIQAYAELRVTDLDVEGVETATARRHHIFETFVDRKLRRDPASVAVA